MGWRVRWDRSLVRFLGRRVRAAVDVEDLAQETYLRLLRARDLGTVRNPQAYLLTVASHVVAEWRENLPPLDLRAALDEDALIDECGPELDFEAHIAQHRLDETLAGASPMMRAVLLLKLRDERPCKEIAQELGISDRQVRRYLARGYERLRKALEA